MLHPPNDVEEIDPTTLTAHGSIMAYIFPTLFIMGFGYAIAESVMRGQLRGKNWPWIGLWMAVVGTIMALVPIAGGRASVLHTFRGAGVFRLVYLDRFNGRKHESVEATESRKARPAISFRDQRGWNSVGLDRSVRDERDHISDPAGSARMAIHH